MRNISVWAKTHQWPARIIIILSFLLLTVTGIITGLLLKDITVTVPAFALIALIITYGLAGIFYPKKTEKRRFSTTGFYRRQKTGDFLLAASTFGMIVCISNNSNPAATYFPFLQAATNAKSTLPGDSTVKNYKSFLNFSASMKNEEGKMLKWKERKKMLKEQVKGIKRSTDLSKGEKTALIILSVLVALGLIYLVTALACNLSCNGAEGAAILVGIGGTAVVIFLLVLAIRGITGKKKKPVEKPGSDTPGN